MRSERNEQNSSLFKVYGLQDSIVEQTTVTIQLNEKGDTVFRSIVTDRQRVRDRSDKTSVENQMFSVKMDSVTVVQKDSMNKSSTSMVTLSPGMEIGPDGAITKRKAGFLTTIKWIFGVICASIVLIIVLRRAL